MGWRSFGVLLVALVCAGACSDASDRYYGTTRPKHGPEEIWYNLHSEPEWLDPNRATDSASGAVVRNLFSGLTQAHPVTLEPMPDVAKGWEITDGGRRYLFHLRPSTWSDGVPVTAHDFVYSWRRVLEPKTASRYATFLYPLRYAEEANRRALMVRGLPAGATEGRIRAWVGDTTQLEKIRMAPELGAAFLHVSESNGTTRKAHAQAVMAKLAERPFEGKQVAVTIADGTVLGVRALSDHLLEVHLNNPLPYFLSVVSFYVAMPVPRHLFASLRARGIREALWTRPEHIVTNGPYTLAEWKFRQFMLLKKNARYWDVASVRNERVRLGIVESYNTTLNLYKAGELDHVGEADLPSEFLDHLRGFDDYRNYPYLATYFLWLNTASPPLDNPKVREALSLAIDRESLVKFVARGGQKPSRDLVPDGVAGYRGVGRKLFDPEAARAALREAGYGPDNPLPTITYRYNTAEAHKQLAEAMQQMWKDNLGITVELENEEWKVYLKHLEKTEFEIARLGWIGDYPDPNTFLEILTTQSGNNHSNWHSAAYDDLLDQANRTLAKEPRLALLRQAETLMLDANPIIPLYVYTRSELVKPYLRGAFGNYAKQTYFKYMHIDDRYYGAVPAPEQDEAPTLLLPDPAPVLDLSPPPDAGLSDAGLSEAGPSDAGPSDAGSADGGAR